MEISSLILDGLRRNDHKAQRELYDLTLPFLRAICSRYLYDQSSIMDILQESYISIFTQIHRYDASKGQLTKWITTILINKCINQNKKVSRRNESEFEIKIHDIGERDAVSNMTDEDLLFILKKMPSGLLNVFNLYIIDGYSHQEISEVLDISILSSRKKLSRAKQWLQSTFRNDEKTIIYLQNSINQAL